MYVAKLNALLQKSCAETSVKDSLAQFVVKIEDALKANQREDVGLATELFLCALQRHLVIDFSLGEAFALADIAIMDIQRNLVSPDRLYVEASRFAYAFMEQSVSAYRSFIPLGRPIPAGVNHTRDVMVQRITKYQLPNEIAERLYEQINEIAAMAERRHRFEPVESVEFFPVFLQFKETLLALRGDYLPTSEVNWLLGMVLFAVPAWLCAAPPAWIAQAVIGGVLLLVGGLYLIFRSPASKRATDCIWNYIGEGPHKKIDVLKKVEECTKDISPEDKRDVRKRLIELQGSPLAEKEQKA